jgi:hypothetical protein
MDNITIYSNKSIILKEIILKSEINELCNLYLTSHFARNLLKSEDVLFALSSNYTIKNFHKYVNTAGKNDIENINLETIINFGNVELMKLKLDDNQDVKYDLIKLSLKYNKIDFIVILLSYISKTSDRKIESLSFLKDSIQYGSNQAVFIVISYCIGYIQFIGNEVLNLH